MLRAETKIFNINKRLLGTLRMKIITHVRSIRDFTVVDHMIINILTGKRDLDFSLKVTNAIVIELYYYMIKNNYTWKLLRDILLKVSTFNKVTDEKVLCKKIKTLLNTKSSLTAKRKLMILKYLKTLDLFF